MFFIKSSEMQMRKTLYTAIQKYKKNSIRKTLLLKKHF